MSLQGNLPFYEWSHTCRIDIASMYRIYTNTIYLYWSTFSEEGSLYIHLTMPTCFILLRFTHICIFQHWVDKAGCLISLSSTNSLRPVEAYICEESNLAFVMIMACCLIGAESFLDKCWFMICNNLISESVLVYGRYVVGLLSIWVRDSRSAVGYDSSIVLMIGFQSVPCRLAIGLKSGDSIPNLTRNDPDINPTGFTVSSATMSVADSWPIHWKFCGFCRFRIGLAGVTGALDLIH